MVNDPQALANDFFTEVEHPSGRKIKYIASPAKFSKTPRSIRATAPEVGQHTEEVLLEIGYSWEDLNELKEKGFIPSAKPGPLGQSKIPCSGGQSFLAMPYRKCEP
ncbi:MAG: CoA transferase [Deltaproteobacteria bacterium]|nr:CoA transferase [Deltaproteobacteria bacterium]